MFEKVLDQCKKNKVALGKYDELEKRAAIVFIGNHEVLEEISTVNFSRIEKMRIRYDKLRKLKII